MAEELKPTPPLEGIAGIAGNMFPPLPGGQVEGMAVGGAQLTPLPDGVGPVIGNNELPPLTKSPAE